MDELDALTIRTILSAGTYTIVIVLWTGVLLSNNVRRGWQFLVGLLLVVVFSFGFAVVGFFRLNSLDTSTVPISNCDVNWEPTDDFNSPGLILCDEICSRLVFTECNHGENR